MTIKEFIRGFQMGLSPKDNSDVVITVNYRLTSETKKYSEFIDSDEMLLDIPIYGWGTVDSNQHPHWFWFVLKHIDNQKIMFSDLQNNEKFLFFDHDKDGNDSYTFTVWQKIELRKGYGVDDNAPFNAICINTSRSVSKVHFTGQAWLFNSTSLVMRYVQNG